jgi:nitrogen fixation NifU-like protein
MNRLDNLYQELILDHNKNPHNFGRLDPHTHYSKGVNPLCGDSYEITLWVKDDIIHDLRFVGSGCAISKSSGSMMTDAIKGKTVTEALLLKDQFLAIVLGTGTDANRSELGRLAVLEGVKKFPARVKCAALVWRAVEDALLVREGTISTE